MLKWGDDATRVRFRLTSSMAEQLTLNQWDWWAPDESRFALTGSDKDTVDCCMRKTKFFSECSHRSPVSKFLANSSLDFRRDQPSFGSSSSITIQDVLTLCSSDQMSGIAAAAVVALMQDVHPLRDLSMHDTVRKPVSKLPGHRVVKLSIAVSSQSTDPRPAGARSTGPVNLCPEASDRFGYLHSDM